MISYVTQPRKNKGGVYPSDLEVSFMPNRMNQFQIPEVMKAKVGFLQIKLESLPKIIEL